MEVLEEKDSLQDGKHTKFLCANGHEFWHDHRMHELLHGRRPSHVPLPPVTCSICFRERRVIKGETKFASKHNLVTTHYVNP